LNTALGVVVFTVSVAPPLTVMDVNLNGPAPLQVTVQGELVLLVVQPEPVKFTLL
jgi:hypothetical protein